MEIHVTAQANDQAVEALKFMAQKVQGRPMLYGLLMTDIHRWSNLPDRDKKRVFERDVRRFSVAYPYLAKKDRIRKTLEALDEASSNVLIAAVA